MAWSRDPTISGATTGLSPTDEQRVLIWLKSRFYLDLDAVQPHGRIFTPWARDLIVRSAVLRIRGVFSDEKVARRVAIARSRDAAFWAEHDTDGDPVDLRTHRDRVPFALKPSPL
jgi:hypothetical protein